MLMHIEVEIVRAIYKGEEIRCTEITEENIENAKMILCELVVMVFLRLENIFGMQGVGLTSFIRSCFMMKLN